MGENSNIKLEDLLHCLIECSEKGAKIAQLFRGEDQLFQLAVEEKSEIQKNKQFVQDFKTLADVLVQETVRRDVQKRFPSLVSKIKGEEVNRFQNALGESIIVELNDSPEDTVSLLCRVLNDRTAIAKSLASVIHSNSSTTFHGYSSSKMIMTSRIGIWIDPIDSTTEYIQAKTDTLKAYDIAKYGLTCVCVLIGVYDTESGYPLLGVINQPFYEKNHSEWKSKIYWGINYGNEKAISSICNSKENSKKIIVISSCESDELQNVLKMKYEVIHAAGAGYKCLLVANEKADLYILSQSTTHFWDTCSPHAILMAKGGGIVNFKDAIQNDPDVFKGDLLNYQIKYSTQNCDSSFKNFGGIIAYRNPLDLKEFLKFLKEKGYKIN